MLNKRVNLIQLCVVKEIQHLKSQAYKDNIILRDRADRESIIEYVLSELNHRYMTLENITEVPRVAGDIFPECPIHERAVILQLLHTKMLDLVRCYLEKLEQKFLTEPMLEEQK